MAIVYSHALSTEHIAAHRISIKRFNRVSILRSELHLQLFDDRFILKVINIRFKVVLKGYILKLAVNVKSFHVDNPMQIDI